MRHNKLVESVCGKSGMKEGGTTANQGQKEAESPPSPSRPCSLGSPALYVCGHHPLLNVPCGLPGTLCHCLATLALESIPQSLIWFSLALLKLINYYPAPGDVTNSL